MKFTLKTHYLTGFAIIIVTLLIVFAGSVSSALALRIFSQGANGSCPNGYTQEYVDGGVTCYNDQDGICEIGSIVCIADNAGGGGGGFGAGSVTLTASPTTIDQGSSSTLSWTGSNLVAGSCAGTGFITGGATSGSKSVSPNDNVTYSITCDASAGGTVSDNATVTVNPIVVPNSEDGGGQGGGGGNACDDGIDNDGDGYVDYPADAGCSGSGGESESQITLQCSDGLDNDGDGFTDYPADDNCSSSQDSAEGFEEVSLSADRTLVPKGQSVNLDWEAVGSLDNCSLFGSNGDSWTLSGTSGSVTTSAINAATTYTLSCEDEEGSPVSSSITVKLVPRFQEQ